MFIFSLLSCHGFYLLYIKQQTSSASSRRLGVNEPMTSWISAGGTKRVLTADTCYFLALWLDASVDKTWRRHAGVCRSKVKVAHAPPKCNQFVQFEYGVCGKYEGSPWRCSWHFALKKMDFHLATPTFDLRPLTTKNPIRSSLTTGKSFMLFLRSIACRRVEQLGDKCFHLREVTGGLFSFNWISTGTANIMLASLASLLCQ